MTDRFAGKAAWFDDHYTSTRGRVRLQLVLERLRRRLPGPPATIFDAGGGTGAYAIPLAADGYEVTLLDASAEWLERARHSASAAGVAVRTVHGSLDDLPALGLGRFDAVLCHAVLMYVDDPRGALRSLRSTAEDGGVLSLLEKNAEAIALRPGLDGDYLEAHRLLTERMAVGRLSVANRAYTIDEWLGMLASTGWLTEELAGVRLFSDSAPDDLDADAYRALRDLERAAGQLDAYRRVSRLIHFLARAG